jgi:hypothetical protein
VVVAVVAPVQQQLMVLAEVVVVGIFKYLQAHQVFQRLRSQLALGAQLNHPLDLLEIMEVQQPLCMGLPH